jgi:hypothetical protein
MLQDNWGSLHLGDTHFAPSRLMPIGNCSKAGQTAAFALMATCHAMLPPICLWLHLLSEPHVQCSLFLPFEIDANCKLLKGRTDGWKMNSLGLKRLTEKQKSFSMEPDGHMSCSP